MKRVKRLIKAIISWHLIYNVFIILNIKWLTAHVISIDLERVPFFFIPFAYLTVMTLHLSGAVAGSWLRPQSKHSDIHYQWAIVYGIIAIISFPILLVVKVLEPLFDMLFEIIAALIN